MNNKQFLAELSAQSGLSSPDTGKKVDVLIEVLKKIWQEGDSLSLSGFGVLEVKKKNERVSVNPVTGIRMLVPPKLAISFKPSPLLKEKLNSKETETADLKD
ncbi:MAG: HU family DNA-binding protein [Bacteroidaceae bacterium]|nr:HU family DNA-binding protein [Bacteroidaceae bacterium]